MMDLYEIMEMDAQYYMNSFGKRIPLIFDRGQQSTLYDSQGKAYIDFLAGIAVNSLGYAHPTVTQAVITQFQKLPHCSNFFYIESQAQLAKLLVENSCGDKVFFGNSGAEANEAAIKLARKYFYDQGMNKYEIITAKNSFHGRTLATVAATGQEKYQTPYQPLPSGFVNVEYNSLTAIEESLSDKTCAVLVETIQGEGGVIEASHEYLKGLRELCDREGILLILDEVQTGMGRTGKLFSYQYFDIEPDVFTLAKALGNGFPIGAVVAKEKFASAFTPGDHGSTFGGNPTACAAGVAVMETLLSGSLMEECQMKGSYFKAKLEQLKGIFPFIRNIRGKGLMLGMELDPSVDGKAIVKEALNRGFIINCTAGNTLRFVPPLVITEQEIDALIHELQGIFNELQG